MTLFSDIIEGKSPAKLLFENEQLIAIEDKYPEAPVHILIIPKRPYPNLQSVPKDELGIVQEVAQAAQELAERFGIAEGYRLLTNSGRSAGQTIFHLHFHLMGGFSLGTLD